MKPLFGFARFNALAVRLALGVAVMPFAGAPAAAQEAVIEKTAIEQATQDRLWDALGVGEALEIMRQEGKTLAIDVADQYLAGRASNGWTRDIDTIYDPSSMDQMMREGMFDDLEGAQTAPMLAFFEAELGRRIVSLEMSARRAFLDPDTESAARERVRNLDEPDTGKSGLGQGRLDLIDEFIAANDLVDYNSSGSMNTNVAFLKGLAQAEVFEMSEQDILDRVWNESEAGRLDTKEWLRAYLATAYQPLTDAEIRAYINFSRTDAGQRLNRALFAGFGEMYSSQYYALGLAVAKQLGAQDI